MGASPWMSTLAVFGLLGCTRPESTPVEISLIELVDEAEAPDDPPTSTEHTPSGPPPLLVIRDPATLIELERELGLLELIGEEPLQAIKTSLALRLASDRAEDPEHTGVGLRHVHRQFDHRWLVTRATDEQGRRVTADTRYELIGVVNRMDRHVFAPEQGFGETRLIYRLAYTRTQQGLIVDSRLPMTINVVFWQRPTGPMPGAEQRLAGMRELAGRWQADPGLAGASLAAWLREPGRPLAVEQLDRALLKSVEINVQTERWPATIRPDLAGHAEYLLQVFQLDSEGRWRAAPLENTPDVERLANDPAGKAELLAWLEDPNQGRALAEGTLVVPERFLARAATSVTPRGLARAANRPWSRLFDEDDFTQIELDDRLARGAAASARRAELPGLPREPQHRRLSPARGRTRPEQDRRRVGAVELAAPRWRARSPRGMVHRAAGRRATQRRPRAGRSRAGAWLVGGALWTRRSGLRRVDLRGRAGLHGAR